MSKALVVGSGRMTRVRLPVLLAHEGVDEVVVATRGVERAADLAGPGVRVVDVTQLDRLGEAPALVLVTSATANHVEDVERALSYGCPVLCEKPITDDAQLAQQLADRAAAAGTPLYVAFQRHWEPALRELRRRIAGGELGPLFHLRFAHFDRHVQRADYIPLSGGVYKDLLMHDIEATLWLAQSPVAQVFASGAVRNRQDYAAAGDYDCATVLLTLADGTQSTLHGMREHPSGHDVRVEAIGARAALSVGLTPAAPLEALDAPGLLGNDPPQTFQDRFATAFDEETRAFADFALGRTPDFDSTPAAVAAEALRVAEACERSDAEARAVEPAAA